MGRAERSESDAAVSFTVSVAGFASAVGLVRLFNRFLPPTNVIWSIMGVIIHTALLVRLVIVCVSVCDLQQTVNVGRLLQLW